MNLIKNLNVKFIMKEKNSAAKLSFFDNQTFLILHSQFLIKFLINLFKLNKYLTNEEKLLYNDEIKEEITVIRKSS